MIKKNQTWLIFSIALVFAGCMGFPQKAQNAVLAKHDEILTFELPYDLTYLRTLEALQTHKDWEIAATDKENGKIQVYNHNYAQLSDADQRKITFLLKRVDRAHTSIQITPEDQAIIGGDDLMKIINAQLSKQR